jgi:SAM-dependent methyltransferase
MDNTNFASESSRLAAAHWNEAPLNVSPEERYQIYPWLPKAAEFGQHRGERVLEIGCGAGVDLEQFANHGALPMAVDITLSHLELARKRLGPRANIYEAEGSALPFEKESFDYVYSHGVLHHIDEPRRVVQEIFRVLRPGGRFTIMVYAYWSVQHLELRLKFKDKWKLYVENSAAPVRIDLYTASSMRSLFAPARLRFEKYECFRLPIAQRWLGWFLVAKGTRSEKA